MSIGDAIWSPRVLNFQHLSSDDANSTREASESARPEKAPYTAKLEVVAIPVSDPPRADFGLRNAEESRTGVDTKGRSCAGQIEFIILVSSGLRKRTVAITIIEIFAGSNAHIVAAHLENGLRDQHQLLRMCVRQRLKQQGVDRAEYSPCLLQFRAPA